MLYDYRYPDEKNRVLTLYSAETAPEYSVERLLTDRRIGGRSEKGDPHVAQSRQIQGLVVFHSSLPLGRPCGRP